GVFIHGREEIEFDNDAVLIRLSHEVLEPAEKGVVPAVEIEAMAAVFVAGRFAPRPRTDQLARCRRQGVALDLERSGRFHVSPWKRAREVHTVRRQSGQILLVIEIEIENRTIMFPGCHQYGGLSAGKEGKRVIRRE